MPDRPTRPRRRCVLRGAVWTTPVLLTATTAPAFAASPCAGFSHPAPSAASWTVANTRVDTAGNGFANNGYTVVGDPTSGDLLGLTPASVVVTGPLVQFTAGQAYRLSYDYSLVSSNPRDLTLTVSVGGAVQTTATPTTTGTRSMELASGFASALLTTLSDDITVSNVSLLCENL